MLETSNVTIGLNMPELKEYIQQSIDSQIRDTFIMVDVDTLVKMTCMSKRFLEEEMLKDPRVKILERRKSKKRYYLYPEIVEVIREITEEW